MRPAERQGEIGQQRLSLFGREDQRRTGCQACFKSTKKPELKVRLGRLGSSTSFQPGDDRRSDYAIFHGAGDDPDTVTGYTRGGEAARLTKVGLAVSRLAGSGSSEWITGRWLDRRERRHGPASSEIFHFGPRESFDIHRWPANRRRCQNRQRRVARRWLAAARADGGRTARRQIRRPRVSPGVPDHR